MNGNILSWEKENWNLTSPYNRSEMEILDFDRDVCSLPTVKILESLSYSNQIH